MTRLATLLGMETGDDLTAFKLQNLCLAFEQRFGSSLLMQGWACSPSAEDEHCLKTEVVMECVDLPCSSHSPVLQHFRERSCKEGITRASLGVIGKVWTGSLQIIQDLAIIPTAVHPRNKLAGISLVSEVLYIPVYDLAQPEEGVVAVLEVLVLAGTQVQISSIISYTADVMSALELSLSKPEDTQSSRSSSPEPSYMQMEPSSPTSSKRGSSPLPPRSPVQSCEARPTAHMNSPPTSGAVMRSPSLARTSSIRCMGSLEEMTH